MTLNHYEVVKPDHPQYSTVNHLIHTLTLSNPDDCTITFVSMTENSNVHFIRHKKRHTYTLEDKYMITVSLIRECPLDWHKARTDESLDVTPDLYNETHTEVEVSLYIFAQSLYNIILCSPLPYLVLLFPFFPSSTT